MYSTCWSGAVFFLLEHWMFFYVTAVKMDEAKRLLEVTKKTPAEIAEVLGYSSQSYFQSVFKKSTGKTPGEYRAEGKGQ